MKDPYRFLDVGPLGLAVVYVLLFAIAAGLVRL